MLSRARLERDWLRVELCHCKRPLEGFTLTLRDLETGLGVRVQMFVFVDISRKIRGSTKQNNRFRGFECARRRKEPEGVQRWAVA